MPLTVHTTEPLATATTTGAPCPRVVIRRDLVELQITPEEALALIAQLAAQLAALEAPRMIPEAQTETIRRPGWRCPYCDALHDVDDQTGPVTEHDIAVRWNPSGLQDTHRLAVHQGQADFTTMAWATTCCDRVVRLPENTNGGLELIMPGPYMLAEPGTPFEPFQVLISVGRDLVVGVERRNKTLEREGGPDYVAFAFDSDGNPLATLGRFPYPPDGETLRLLVGIAGVHLPDHVNLREV